MRPKVTPIRFVIAIRQFIQGTYSDLKIRCGITVVICRRRCRSIRLLKTGEYNRSLIDIRTFNTICRQKNNRRTPVKSVQALIHAPFIHGGIIDHIRCPHIPLDGVSAHPGVDIIGPEVHLGSLSSGHRSHFITLKSMLI